MNELAQIQQKGAPPGSARYYSLLSLSSDRRACLTALYALQQSLAEVAEEHHDATVAEARLRWWREEIARLFDGVPQHPVTRVLAHHDAPRSLPREEMLALVDGAELTLRYDTYPGFRELSIYLHQTGSTPALLAARLLGGRHSHSYAHHLGTALVLLRRLLAIREDIQHRRLFIPEDELARFDLKLADLQQFVDTRESRALFRFQAERIRSLFQQAEPHLAEEDRYWLSPLLIRQQLSLALVEELDRADFPLLSQRLHLTPLRKFWLAWRLTTRERRRHRRLGRSSH